MKTKQKQIISLRITVENSNVMAKLRRPTQEMALFIYLTTKSEMERLRKFYI